MESGERRTRPRQDIQALITDEARAITDGGGQVVMEVWDWVGRLGPVVDVDAVLAEVSRRADEIRHSPAHPVPATTAEIYTFLTAVEARLMQL